MRSLQPLSPAEQTIWRLDASHQQPAVSISIETLAAAAQKLAAAAAPEIDAELAKITGDAVTSINQIARLQAWLQERLRGRELGQEDGRGSAQGRNAVAGAARAGAAPGRRPGGGQEDRSAARSRRR